MEVANSYFSTVVDPSITTMSAPAPWGNTNIAQVYNPCSLKDVMSEQLAADLQKEEEHTKNISSSDMKEPDFGELVAAAAASGEDTANDLLLAQMLQHEFDKEHDQQLKREESHYNGNNKVAVSFQNFRAVHPAYDDEEEEEEEVTERKTEWDVSPPSYKKNGTSGSGKNITTKHDAVICGRRNASKLMDLPPEFHSGDGEGMDLKLSNKVYNKLKLHSEAENKRSQRLHEKKEHSTAEHVMDPRTKLLLYKMVNNGTLDSISGSISTGKESVVFHAYGGSVKDKTLSEECAIKIYKTTLNEFKNREQYIHGDHRFSKDDYKKHNPRKIIKMWGEKETANLNRMKKFGIPCPHVQLLRKHILVMSFIGKDGKPASKLKDACLDTADLEVAYAQMEDIMKKMYSDCALVHADLSEYNILWYKDQVWIIDVSQAVDLTHPRAMQFLLRDCRNISSFFRKSGVHDVLSPEELFNHITDLKITGKGKDFEAQVQRYDKEKSAELLANQSSFKSYPFDYFFEKSLKERTEECEEENLDDRDDPFEYFYEKSLKDKEGAEAQVSSDSDSDIDESSFVLVDKDKINLG
ncbi:hypothetical protein FSP39_015427 [Pinctada imbricata]|uniref:Serine/threonine-protein kinase RIO3 n=1 Tax=Pinctada imbricata TaxID=66713 RepID=A0AA89BNN9_PINIB|nr:hypothetical protein FSP39_015427 [Pinctada imbricata]